VEEAAAASNKLRGCPPAIRESDLKKVSELSKRNWYRSREEGERRGFFNLLGAGVAARGALFPDAGEGVPGGFAAEGGSCAAGSGAVSGIPCPIRRNCLVSFLILVRSPRNVPQTYIHEVFDSSMRVVETSSQSPHNLFFRESH
jgi:hypothetical protein